MNRASTYRIAVGLQSLMERGMGGRAASQNRGPQPAQGSPTVSEHQSNCGVADLRA
jgi:hypothetical protein